MQTANASDLTACCTFPLLRAFWVEEDDSIYDFLDGCATSHPPTP